MSDNKHFCPDCGSSYMYCACENNPLNKSEPSQDDIPSPDQISIAMAFFHLNQIDERECSLEAWNRICNAKELLDDH